MNIQVYKTAFSNLSERIQELSIQYEKRKLFFYLDALKGYICYGITPNEYMCWHWYSLSRLERKRFYTFRWERKFRKKLIQNPEHVKYFLQKQLFNEKFHDFVKRDWIYVPACTEEKAERFLQEHERVIVKPCAGSSGQGVHLYNREDTFARMKENCCLLEECILQNSELAKLNGSSVNTLRISTLLDQKGKAHILSAGLRVGNGGVTDNLHGGVIYPVDVATGVVKNAGRDNKGRDVIIHPNSNQCVVGVTIPHWERCIEFVKNAALLFPDIRYVGWDVAVTENGFEMIEGNHDGNPHVLQISSERGLLADIKKRL